jgi:CBS domain-containing protein/sporulation protein YlmC with PRC-barrel domain
MLPLFPAKERRCEMTTQKTFYLSKFIGTKVYDADDAMIGRVSDLLVYMYPSGDGSAASRAKVVGLEIKSSGEKNIYAIHGFSITKDRSGSLVICREKRKLQPEIEKESLSLVDNILDKQIVDINGKKLVRVNDIRMVTVSDGLYAIAVDVGMEGLLRRIGIDWIVGLLLAIFRVKTPSHFILWEDVEAIDTRNLNIKLSMQSSKLNTLHPSDLADIIEELDKSSRTAMFESMDEERAADVLEELEEYAQVHIIESLPVSKAADLLEKMPADEAADVLEALEIKKAESLLVEMESEASKEVRELMEYEYNSVGSIMSTDFFSFHKNVKVSQVLEDIRLYKPEEGSLYSLFVTNPSNELIGTFTLRDIILADPNTTIESIMKTDAVSLCDEDKMDSVAELVSKYNLLAVPVVDQRKKLQGMVVVDDIVEDLTNKKRTNKR